jgi:hypothetical protein
MDQQHGQCYHHLHKPFLSMRTILVFLVISTISHAHMPVLAQEWTRTVVGAVPVSQIPTNVFLTDKGLGDTIFVTGTNGSRLVPRKALEAALKSPESRPAAEYPEGHWGPVVKGWQLSLRLSTNAVSPGQPLYGTMLLRNVTEKEMTYTLVGLEQEAFAVIWLREDNTLVSRVAPPLPEGLISPHHLRFQPRTQRQFSIRIDSGMPEKARGKLLVSVSTRVYGPGKPKEVSSGSAAIIVFDVLPSNKRGGR